MLVKANIAASIFSKFEPLSEPISVTAHSLVVLGIREMPQDSFN